MLILALIVLGVPCLGLIAAYYVEYWQYNIRMADERARRKE